MAKTNNADNVAAFTKVITTLATEAIDGIDGVTLPEGKKSRGAVTIYILSDERVSVEVFVNILLGYSVPKTVADMQESIKNEIERTTKFKVQSVNVHVLNVITD